MSGIGWHHGKDESHFAAGASDASSSSAARALQDGLARLADAIDAELARARAPAASVTRLVIEDAMGEPASSRPAAAFDEEALLADDVPLPPPPSFLPPSLMRRRAAPARTPMRTVARKIYFAFDFDDLARVDVVRETGKVGLRETIQRGFYDRAVWESRAAKNEAGMLALVREAVKSSSAVCVLVGAGTWRSRWVKYEIARAVVEERGLLAVHINSVEQTGRNAPERPGVNPLHAMGLYQHESGHCYLVERHEVVRDASTGALGFEWRLYAEHAEPVLPPRYVGEIEPGRAVPLSLFTAEHDFMADDGAANIGAWIDTAAAEVGR